MIIESFRARHLIATFVKYGIATVAVFKIVRHHLTELVVCLMVVLSIPCPRFLVIRLSLNIVTRILEDKVTGGEKCLIQQL